MKIEELEQQISNPWDSIDFRSFGSKLASEGGYVPMLLQLTQSANKKVAWRAAYLTDIINQNDSNQLTPHIDELRNRTARETEQGVLRHFSRILLTRNASDYADGEFIDTCIKHLTDRKSAIAVKANFLTITHQLLTVYPELKQEMESVFDIVNQDSSPGIRSRFRKLIDKNE